MAVIHFLWLMLFCWSVAEVYCQAFPYVSFMGQTLANHSYVNLSLVGDHHSGESVECVTDLSTCCSNTQGVQRGDWYFPDGTRLPFSGDGDIYEQRGFQRVYLGRRNRPNSPSGIYRCDIPTNAVHDDTDTSVRDTVYVGLYPGSEGMFPAKPYTIFLTLHIIKHDSLIGEPASIPCFVSLTLWVGYYFGRHLSNWRNVTHSGLRPQ